jgi:hypothetical protein
MTTATEPRRKPTSYEEHLRVLHLDERRFVSEFVLNDWEAFHMRAETAFEHEHQRHRQRLIGSLYAELDRRIVVKQPAIEHSCPNTWWDAFKLRWFPRWLLWRFPAKRTMIRYAAINIDEPVYKACYVNLPRTDQGGGMCLYEAVKPEHDRERERYRA